MFRRYSRQDFTDAAAFGLKMALGAAAPIMLVNSKTLFTLGALEAVASVSLIALVGGMGGYLNGLMNEPGKGRYQPGDSDRRHGWRNGDVERRFPE
jgi:hypothetical protein